MPAGTMHWSCIAKLITTCVLSLEQKLSGDTHKPHLTLKLTVVTRKWICFKRSEQFCANTRWDICWINMRRLRWCIHYGVQWVLKLLQIICSWGMKKKITNKRQTLTQNIQSSSRRYSVEYKLSSANWNYPS